MLLGETLTLEIYFYKMAHIPNPKTFNADRIRAHEIAGTDKVSSNVISGNLVEGKTGDFGELYVAGVQHIPKKNFIYAFRFGGPCTELDHEDAEFNNNYIYVSEPELFASGDHMIIDCGGSGEETRLVSGVESDGSQNFVRLDDNLFYNHNTGIQVCNKFGTLSSGLTTGGCLENCYDAAHLYMEVGTGMEHLGGDMTWYATGYREHFIGYSGVEANITGLDIYGLLTFIYPD